MVEAIRSFLEFCYIARRDVHDTHTLAALDNALQRFHHAREIFRTSGIRRNGFNLPRQHSLIHYVKLIRAFGAPNGLCSSITESKHIKAVKEPWRRSNRFEALSQMLLTNQRLDKLAAAHVDFEERDMLQGSCLSAMLEQLLRMFPVCLFLKLRLIYMDIGTVELEFAEEGQNDDENTDDINDENEADDNDNDGAVDGPTVEAFVELAKTSGNCFLTHHCPLFMLSYVSSA
jgi:hypothetical protein